MFVSNSREEILENFVGEGQRTTQKRRFPHLHEDQEKGNELRPRHHELLEAPDSLVLLDLGEIVATPQPRSAPPHQRIAGDVDAAIARPLEPEDVQRVQHRSYRVVRFFRRGVEVRDEDAIVHRLQRRGAHLL